MGRGDPKSHTDAVNIIMKEERESLMAKQIVSLAGNYKFNAVKKPNSRKIVLSMVYALKRNESCNFYGYKSRTVINAYSQTQRD